MYRRNPDNRINNTYQYIGSIICSTVYNNFLKIEALELYYFLLDHFHARVPSLKQSKRENFLHQETGDQHIVEPRNSLIIFGFFILFLTLLILNNLLDWF